MTEYFSVAVFAHAVYKHDGAPTIAEAAAAMHRSPSQMPEIVTAAMSAGAVVAEGKHLALTESGADLATSVESAIQDARARGRIQFCPYTDYIPERWLPED